MSGVDYVVRTRYEIEDATASKLASMGSSFSGLGKLADMAGGAMDAVASKLFAVGAAGLALAGAGGIAAIKTGLVDVNAKLEDTEIGFATIFNMLGATGSFTSGLGMAKELMAGIRADAAALPGEFQDFVAMAQTISSPLVNAGKGIGEIRELTRDTVVSAAALGVQYDQAAREMAQLLEGHAGGHNVLGLRMGITAHTQVNGKDFNKASASERYDFLRETMKKAQDSLPAFQKSWSGLTSTMADQTKMLLGRTTAPLFERIKTSMWALVGDGGLLEKNSHRIDELTKSAGHGLVVAYDWALDRTVWLKDHWSEIRDSSVKFGHDMKAGFDAAWPVVQKIGSFLGESLKDPTKFMLQFAGIRGGLAIASNAGGIGSALGGAGLGEGAAMGAAAAPLGLLALAAIGVVDVFTTGGVKMDGTFKNVKNAGDIAWSVWSDVKKNAGEAAAETKSAFEDLGVAVRPLVDVLGISLVGAVDAVVIGFRNLASPMFAFASVVGALTKTSMFGAGAAVGDYGNKYVDTLTQKMDWYNNGPKAMDRSKLDAELAQMATGAVNEAKKMKGAGKVNVTVHAPLTVLSDADPERLARKVATHIGDELRNARTSLALRPMRAI